ncbi:MAG: hypothetical protein BRC25_00515 [Parcubacteria group bacterium SW_6_46_9]|nr:MAG: hypothetical protein BRC25_00515 [Parcubacteria group bacterium SW_6_46_9]
MEVFISLVGIIFAVLIVSVAGVWKVFTKAGESGWKAIIPFYNSAIMLRIGGHSGWWVMAFILPLLPWLFSLLLGGAANAQGPGGYDAAGAGGSSIELTSALAGGGIVAILVGLLIVACWQLIMLASVVMLYDVARSFGKGMGFTFGLMVLPFVFWPILGFGDAEYRGPAAHPNMVEQGSGAHIDKDRS